MVKLVRMTQPEFDEFLQRDIREYAQENIRSGYWDETGALEKSRREHKNLLPDGLATRNHQIYTIRNEQDSPIGVIWIKVDLSSQKRPSGFIFDLEIDEQYRRQGYATQAMLELEKIAAGLGLKYLGLHVFAHNKTALTLYEKLGYSVAGLNMLKEIP